MGLFSSLSDLFNKHVYSIVTAVIIAVLTFGYLSYILPNNQQKEDAKNIIILQGIEKQLAAYIDDQVKHIDEDTIDSSDDLSGYRGSTDFYINNITINNKKYQEFENGTIKLSRKIELLNRAEDFIINSHKKKLTDSIPDEITIDLVKFLNKIDSTTYFTSFYICPVVAGMCQSHKSFLSKNVSLADQDSLTHYDRHNGPFSFKNSSVRYYTNQIKIPQTDKTIFLAVGIQKSVFDSNVQQIDPYVLIFSFISVIFLILGINFIKPIISSYKERLSQFDLVGVVFSIGLLIAILVIFATLSYWNNAVKTRTISDLDQLVNKIDSSFSDQITAYESWKNDNLLLGTAWKSSETKFSRIYLKTDLNINYLNEDPLPKNDLSSKHEYIILKKNDFEKDTNNLKLIKYLDHYFRMNNKGIITKDLTTTKLDIPRKYADRMYFKILQQKNTDNIKTGPVLTAVFSRDSDKYQLIYAEKDSPQKPKSGIEGIAFREYFSDELELPPGTGYMLVDRYGNIILQNDPEKNLYQNLYYESQSNPEFASVLSGTTPKSFEMEYQGRPYQIYAKKLSQETASPIYILGVRDLSYLNRLSIFSFTNGFLISVLYGFFILLINYIYSVIFYSGRISALSKHHFYYLFPDSSRTNEYKKLLLVNSICILLAIIISFMSTPSLAFVFCIVLGINVAFINLITLNIRTLTPKKEVIKLVLILFIPAICLPMISFFYYNALVAAIVLFVTHILLTFCYRNWRKRQEDGGDHDDSLAKFVKKNKGVNRKAYTKFLTARLLYQFIVFPFILISTFYVSELNDFSRYYCSSLDTKEQNIKIKPDFIIKDRITNAYNCNCKKETKDETTDQVIQKANLGFFDRPVSYEIKNFTFNTLNNKYYLNSLAIFQNGNDIMIITLSLLIFILFLTILAYQLLNYYSNRFFFYDLMQAYYEKYYPCKINELANGHIFIPMANSNDIKQLIQVDKNCETGSDKRYKGHEDCPDRKISINEVFDQDDKNEIYPYLRMDFILNINHKQFCYEYEDIWHSLTEDTQFILFDFAQDHFVNYKNKDTLISLMEMGIIDCHKITGRLKMMSLSFRIFILSKSKREDDFIQKFNDQSKNGTYSKLRFPIIIIAVSALILLMYLNKDSYDQVTLVGGSVVTVLALINKILDANKSL